MFEAIISPVTSDDTVEGTVWRQNNSANNTAPNVLLFIICSLFFLLVPESSTILHFFPNLRRRRFTRLP